MSDSCNHCYVGRTLEIAQEIKCQVLEAPPSLVWGCPDSVDRSQGSTGVSVRVLMSCCS